MSAVPRSRLAVVTCMDARIDVLATFGLKLGDAHVIRNAGAVVSDDVLRSLALSQRLLETRSVRIVAHTSCGLLDLDARAVAEEMTRGTGRHLPFDLGAFSDLDDHVRDQVAAVRGCPWLLHADDVLGQVLDVETGTLRDVIFDPRSGDVTR